MKHILSLSFLLLFTFTYSQNGTPISTASMMVNSAKITINHCTEKDTSSPTLNRIVVQPDFSDQELEFLQQLPLSERDILIEATFDGEFSWRLELTGKKNQYRNRLVQLFK